MSRYLVCRSCGHREVCHRTQMVTRLRQLGMLRRAADPDLDLLDELFPTATAKMQCASCGEAGLAIEEVADEGWEDERCCEECGKVIPRKRLDILPGALRCAACEQQGEIDL